MVLDNTQVDSTGLTCDTVGVNEQAFVSQGSRCDVEAGSCLHGQIMALEKARGRTPRRGTGSRLSRLAVHLAVQEAFDSLIRRESCKYLFQCLSQEGWKHPYLENSGQLQVRCLHHPSAFPAPHRVPRHCRPPAPTPPPGSASCPTERTARSSPSSWRPTTFAM